jgi:hypothetical protein
MPGSLKTHGESHGEKKDISELREETLVESLMQLLTL